MSEEESISPVCCVGCWWSFNRRESSQFPSITVIGCDDEDIETPIPDGEMELARDPGEFPSDEPQPELNPRDCEWLPSYVLPLSFPVGPFPSGTLDEGGRRSAKRRQLFSSSNSATLCSKA